MQLEDHGGGHVKARVQARVLEVGNTESGVPEVVLEFDKGAEWGSGKIRLQVSPTQARALAKRLYDYVTIDMELFVAGAE